MRPLGLPAHLRGDWTVFALSLAIAALVIWAHRSNIRKLARGEERRFAFHKDGEKPETGSDATDGSDQGGAR